MSFGGDKIDDDVDLFTGLSLFPKSSKHKGEIVLKVVVVGDGGVGKTCLIVTQSSGNFPYYLPNIFENYSTFIKHNGMDIRLNLWDTAGQEEYDELRVLAYPSTDVFLVCFSVVNKNTFKDVTEKWIPEIKRHRPNAPFILVGTKVDLRDTSDDIEEEEEEEEELKRPKVKYLEPVTHEDGLQLAKKLNAYSYVECSSLKGKNLDILFDDACVLSMYPYYYGSQSSSSSAGGIIEGIVNFFSLKINKKGITLSEYRKLHLRNRQFLKDQFERKEKEKVEKFKKLIQDEISLARKERSEWKGLSFDIIQFILNRYVLIDVQKDCYPLREEFVKYRDRIGLSNNMENFVMMHYFGYFRRKPRLVFQLFYNFRIPRKLYPKNLYLPSNLQYFFLSNGKESFNNVELIPGEKSYSSRKMRMDNEIYFHPKYIYDSNLCQMIVELRNIIFPNDLRTWKTYHHHTIHAFNLEETLLVVRNMRFRSSYPVAETFFNFYNFCNTYQKLEILEVTSYRFQNDYQNTTDTEELSMNMPNLKRFSLRSPFLFDQKLIDFSSKNFPSLEILEICFHKNLKTNKPLSEKKLSKQQFKNICSVDTLPKLRVVRLEFVDLSRVEDLLVEGFLNNGKFEVVNLQNCPFNVDVLDEKEHCGIFEKSDKLMDIRIVCTLYDEIFPDDFIHQFKTFREKRENNFMLFKYKVVSSSQKLSNL